MRALVVYESMYGNTRVVASNIADGLRATHEVTLVPVAGATGDLVAGADLLVGRRPDPYARAVEPGHPADGSPGGRQTGQRTAAWTRTPAAPGLRDWLKGIGGGHALVAAFDTRFNGVPAFTGRASRGIGRLLKRHGYRLIAAPESFLVGQQNTLLDGEAARPAAGRRPRRHRQQHRPPGTGLSLRGTDRCEVAGEPVAR